MPWFEEYPDLFQFFRFFRFVRFVFRTNRNKLGKPFFASPLRRALKFPLKVPHDAPGGGGPQDLYSGREGRGGNGGDGGLKA